jgi:hypothetical protein
MLVALLLLPLSKQKQQRHHIRNGQHHHSDVVACWGQGCDSAAITSVVLFL